MPAVSCSTGWKSSSGGRESLGGSFGATARSEASRLPWYLSAAGMLEGVTAPSVSTSRATPEPAEEMKLLRSKPLRRA
ncbi:hypothetical protein AB0F91_19615 [Amycolatopsis sp. NPDC023774]|uniref:hypothetical protein n=1 Tax=Amycolatopsis sp. NPDC023774 TaxID=3155015 RepID=UPI0033CF638F